MIGAWRVAGCGLWVAGCGLRVAGCGLRVTGCGLRVAGCGLRVAGYGLRVAGCGLRVAGCGLRVAGCGLRVAGCGLRVTGCGLRVAGCGLRVAGWVAGCGLRVMGCGLRVAGCGLRVAGYGLRVAVFPNDAPLVQPMLSQLFTDALQTKFLRQTNLRLIEDGGDLHFEGSITGYSTMPTAISGDDRAALNRLTISVRVKFINEFEEDNSFERTFTRFYDYPSNLSLSQVEAEAIEIITEALVEDIFNQSVVNW
jgi:hypothetical protein